jgi:hypothetical protein
MPFFAVLLVDVKKTNQITPVQPSPEVPRQLMAANYGAAGRLIVGVDPSHIERVLDRNDGLVAATLGPSHRPQSLSSAAYNSNW